MHPNPPTQPEVTREKIARVRKRLNTWAHSALLAGEQIDADSRAGGLSLLRHDVLEAVSTIDALLATASPADVGGGDAAQAAELLRRVLRAADSGSYRDRTELSIAAHPVMDDIREWLAALSAPPVPAQCAALCEDCPPTDYPTDKTRCLPCPRAPTTPPPEEPSNAAKLLAYDHAHATAVELGYPSITEALETLTTPSPEVREAMEALRPFKRAIEWYDAHPGCAGGLYAAQVSEADFRRAARALASLDGKGV